MDKIIIIYYIYLPNNGRNWKSVVGVQLDDLKICEINNAELYKSELYIQISSEFCNLIDECIIFINKRIKAVIRFNLENLYEYPGLKLVYDLAKLYPECILFYMHSKGMVFTCDNKEKRNNTEKVILRNTLQLQEKAMNVFKENKNINKVGLYPAEEGFMWFNFFWVRASYFENKSSPIISDDRFYYEKYIGFEGKYNDCYSIIENRVCYFTQPNVLCNLYSLINNSTGVNIYYDKNDYIFEYGTKTDKIDITEKVLKYCLKENCIFIPSGDNNRANLFGDPLVGIVKSIFINGTEYT